MGNDCSVSVIVLNYNGDDFAINCIDSILASDLSEFELVLFDNGSTDGSLESVKRRHGADPRIKILVSPTNLGFAAGNNAAAEHSKGDVLVFLNNDTIVAKGDLTTLVGTLISDPDAGIALPITSEGHRDNRIYIGGVDLLGRPSLLDITGVPPDSVRTFAAGPAFAVRRAAWESVRGFDPKYFVYMEDIDLAWRIGLLGFHVKIVPTVTIVHRGGATTSRIPKAQRVYFRFRNQTRTLIKNFSLGDLLVLGPTSLLYSFFEAIYLTSVSKSTEFLKSWSRALGWNLRFLRDTLITREQVQRSRRVQERAVREIMTFPGICPRLKS